MRANTALLVFRYPDYFDVFPNDLKNLRMMFLPFSVKRGEHNVIRFTRPQWVKYWKDIAEEFSHVLYVFCDEPGHEMQVKAVV